MKSILVAFAASVALVAGLFVGAATGPATAVVRDDGAHHARHTQRDDGLRNVQVAKAKRDDGAHHARHSARDDGSAHDRGDDHPHRHGPRHG